MYISNSRKYEIFERFNAKFFYIYETYFKENMTEEEYRARFLTWIVENKGLELMDWLDDFKEEEADG